MSDRPETLERQIRQILAEAEAPYSGKPGEVYLDRAWHSGAAYIAEQFLAQLDAEAEPEETPNKSHHAARRFDYLKHLVARIMRLRM